MSKSKDKNLQNIDTKSAVMALEYLLAAGYVSKKRLYFENFMRGLFFSFGSIVGAAIVATILLWFLSFFDTLPFINDIAEAIRGSVK